MSEEPINDPALALALYASTAATAAVAALRNARLIDGEVVEALVTNLTLCRQLGAGRPELIEHAELLTDLLLRAGRPQGD